MYIVEFSLAQRCFHKTTLQDMCDTNLKNVAKRFQADYVPIFASESEDEVDKFMILTKDEIVDYSLFKNANGETVIPN